MEITSFSPLIMSNDADSIAKVFEDMGFVKQHEKKDVPETNHAGGFRMKDAAGHNVSIGQVDRLQRDMTAIQMNVSDFDEAMELLSSRGFKNMRGEGNVIDTGSSKTAVMISPAGYAINVVYHIK
ncbi:MAG: hypothetical protein IJJ41_09320 [Clostridia bacterium]|nr:hypothetical protein [Clostridia bacterium]